MKIRYTNFSGFKTACVRLLSMTWLDNRQRTRRLATESTPEKNEILLNAIMERGRHGIILSERGRLTFFNHALEGILQYDAKYFVGKSMDEFIRTVHLQSELEPEIQRLSRELGRPAGFEEIFLHPLEKCDTYEKEWTLIRGDGTLTSISLTLTALRDTKGRMTGTLAVAQDISERKKMDQIKNDFISTVSHELRTPLTTIRAVLGILNSGVMMAESSREMISMAHKNCERLVSLIGEMLDAEKIESGNLPLHMKQVKAGDIIRQAIEINRGHAYKNQVVFISKRIMRDACVMVDPDRLMQVLSNLLSNAAKFSPPGSEVWLSVEPLGSKIRFQIRDFGGGIPEDFQKKIFEKFVRADSTNTRYEEGAGLGLYIAKNLVEAMNGSIGFNTEKGEGTTFFFDLPAMESYDTTFSSLVL